MCTCGKPTNNRELRGYLSPPAVREHEEIIFDEPGRCGALVEGTTPIDYHSHHFQLVKGEYGDIILRVHHGGGEEQINDYSLRKLPAVLEKLDSDARYLILHAFHDIHRKSAKEAAELTAGKYRLAFVEGRLKKRKERGGLAYKVWIETKVVAAL